MIRTAELNLQRKLSAMFIEADPLEIQLERRTATPDGSGGITSGALSPVGGLQRMRLIPKDDGTIERLTADGRQVTPSYTLMGLFNADMQRWDEFGLDNRRYQIVFINENRQYEVKGEVAYLG